MDIMIQSLKRLYAKGLIGDADLERLAEQGKISRETVDVIRQAA